MVLNYFNPEDLVEHEATFNYIAKSGVGFALTPENEQVFIPTRDVERMDLQVGDGLRVWAVDNHATPETSHFPSRWRAVRVQVLNRIEDLVRSVPNDTPVQSSAPAPAPTPKPLGDFVGMLDTLLEESRPWTVSEMTQAMARRSAPLSAQPDLLQRVGTRLNAMHKTGDVACLKVYSKAENDRASAVYYAKNVDVFYDHLDTPLNDEEE